MDECTTLGGCCPAGVPAVTRRPPVFLRGCVVTCMGDVVHLAQVRGRRERAARRRGAAPAFFYFDLACPFSYLAAERVERLFARIIWRPVLGEGIHRGDPWADPLRAAAARTAAERRAAELRVPLVWPERDGAGAGASL